VQLHCRFIFQTNFARPASLTATSSHVTCYSHRESNVVALFIYGVSSSCLGAELIARESMCASYMQVRCQDELRVSVTRCHKPPYRPFCICFDSDSGLRSLSPSSSAMCLACRSRCCALSARFSAPVRKLISDTSAAAGNNFSL